MKRTLLILLVLALFTLSTLAQDAPPVPYTWDLAGVTFLYPSDWDEPLPEEEGEIPTLQLAEALVDTPEIRPPSIPQITFSLFFGADTTTGDFSPALQTALGAADLQASAAPTPITLLNRDGQEIVGASSDGQFYGIGQAVAISDDLVLVVVGRTLEAQRESFERVYDLVTSSLASSTGAAPEGIEDFTEEPDDEDITTAYGVLWRTQRTFDQGEDAFLNLIGLTYAANDRVYSYDYDLGLVQIDAQTGNVLGIFPNENIEEPTALAADANGVVYLSDIICGCIYVFDPAGSWRDAPIGNLGENALQSITVTPDGRIFGTGEDEEGFITVVVLQNGTLQQTITLPEEVFSAPLLVTDRTGRALAITQDGDGVVLSLENNAATPVYTLDAVAEFVLAAAVDLNNNFVLATDSDGVIIVDTQGNIIDQPAPLSIEDPLPGEVVYPTGVAVSPAGTLYVADSDGQFGAVIAFSTNVPQGQVGASELLADVPVQGTLTLETPSQSWTFQGTAGQRVTISAADGGASGELDVAVRLIAPDGSEEAFNDDQEGIDLFNQTDAQIVNHPLAQSGAYTIQVESADGEGTYQLALSETRAFTLENNSATLQGTLDDINVAQRWQFQAQGGETLDMTLVTTDGDLDPLLRVVSPQGEVIAENDDAEEEDMGTDSQLVGVMLPEAGTYLLEAARFDGVGSYTLTITSSPAS